MKAAKKTTKRKTALPDTYTRPIISVRFGGRMSAFLYDKDAERSDVLVARVRNAIHYCVRP